MTPECPVCRKALDTPLITGAHAEGSFRDIYRCAECRVAVTFPLPTAGELASLYSGGSYRSRSGGRFVPLVESFVSFARDLRRRRIMKFRSGGRILDIGCGRGLFLRIMERHGWSVAGVEFSEETASRLRETCGIDVRTGDLADLGFPGESFDVITMNHVLEHLFRPREAIDACRRLLRPGGLLVVAVPNIGSLQAAAGGKVWFHLDPPRHVVHYTEEGLSALLKRHSFDVARVRRFDAEYNPFGWLQTLLNVTGIRKNLLFDVLKNRELRGGGLPDGGRPGLALSILLLPLYFPLSVVLSVVESFFPGRSGTFEMIAFKRESPVKEAQPCVGDGAGKA